MKPEAFDLAGILESEFVSTRPFIAPMIYRLAKSRKDWRSGDRDIRICFRPTVTRKQQDRSIRICWDQSQLVLDYNYTQIREDLRKLRNSINERAITEQAALGIAFATMKILMPNDRITKVVPIGDRGDFYLNGRRDEMVEISGTLENSLGKVFSTKKTQILLNRTLRKAIVSVSRFSSAESRLERVR